MQVRHSDVFWVVVLAAIATTLLGGCTPAQSQSQTQSGQVAESLVPSSQEPEMNDEPVVTPPVPSRQDIGTEPLAAVPVGRSVVMDGGLKVRVAEVKDVEIRGVGPGELSGPGTAVYVTVENTAQEPIDLSGSSVNATFGGVPASPSSAAPSSQLLGVLSPGSTQAGVYVFSKPPEAQGVLVVEFEHNQSSDVVQVRK